MRPGTHIDILLRHLELIQALRGAVTCLLKVSLPLVKLADLGLHDWSGLLQLLALALHHQVELKHSGQH